MEKWLPLLPAGATLHVSHVDHHDLTTLATAHPSIAFRARVGTALWHGDKSPLRLRADVLDRRPVAAGDRVGYRLSAVPGAGSVVMVSGGTAHGVQPLPDGRSPFHFAQRRLALVEPPHMHTSMVFVPAGTPTARARRRGRPPATPHPDLGRRASSSAEHGDPAIRGIGRGRQHLDGRGPLFRPRNVAAGAQIAAEDAIAAEKPGIDRGRVPADGGLTRR